jgi:hypothetical protein
MPRRTLKRMGHLGADEAAVGRREGHDRQVVKLLEAGVAGGASEVERDRQVVTEVSEHSDGGREVREVALGTSALLVWRGAAGPRSDVDSWGRVKYARGGSRDEETIGMKHTTPRLRSCGRLLLFLNALMAAMLAES